MFKQVILTLGAGSVLLSASTLRAQDVIEGFDGGSNQGAWVIGNCGGEVIESSGGVPGDYLHSTSVCGLIPRVYATQPGAPFAGSFRDQGVVSLGLDMIAYWSQSGYAREMTVFIANDSGTPGDDTDDCMVYLLSSMQMPQPGAGWATFDFMVASDSPTLPAGWTIGTLCNGSGSADATWNSVMDDVSYFGFAMGDPLAIYSGNFWDLGVDNIRMQVGGLGDSYCTSSPTSTGEPALISATGSLSIAADNLRLSGAPVPANQNGIFFYGPTQLSVPFGNGTLCVGAGSSGIGRLPVVNSGPSGRFEHQLDYSSPPTASTLISAGSTWNFQVWFRDPAAGGAFFNTSNAVEIDFIN